MKKSLLRFVALCTIISIVALSLPGLAIAEGGNLISQKNPGFETGDITNWSGGASASASADAKRTGSYGVSFTSTGSSYGGDLRITSFPYTNGQWYRFSGYVKAGDEASIGKSIRLIAQRGGGGTVQSGPKFTLTADWQEISYIYKITSETGNSSMHIGVVADSGAVVYADDFALEAYIVPELTAVAEATVTDSEVTVEYTFSNTLTQQLTADDFTVSGGSAQKSLSVKNGVYIITLTGLTASTEYTVMLTGTATDKFGGTLTGVSKTFTTPAVSTPEEDSNLISKKNPGFETGDTTNWSSGVSATASADAKRTGSYGVSFTSTGSYYGGDLRITGLPFTDGQWYRFSGYVKAGNEASVGKNIKLVVQRGGGGSTQTGPKITLTADWQEISYIYKVTSATGNNSMHIGVVADSGAVVYADDFALEAYIIPELTVTSETTVTGNEATVKYTFNNALSQQLTADDFTVTGGAATKSVANSGNICTLTLTGLSYLTDYKVVLSGTATDAYNGTLTGTEVEFRTPKENLISNYNPEFEQGTTNKWDTSLSSAIASADAKRTGSYGVSFTSTGSTYGGDLRITSFPFTDGQWYRFSGYAKAGDEASIGKSIRLIAQRGGGGTVQSGPKFTLTADWQEISYIYKITSATGNSSMHIGVVADSGAVVYADDFCLEKVNLASVKQLKVGDNDFSEAVAVTDVGDAQIVFELTNCSNSSIKPVVFATVYDDDCRLLGVSLAKESKPIALNKSARFDIDINISENADGGNLKVFAWYSFDSMIPIVPPQVYQIEFNN